MTAWAESVSLADPDSVLTNARDLPTHTLREVARLIFTQRWLEEDPLMALTLTGDFEIDRTERLRLVNQLSLAKLKEVLQQKPTIETELFKPLIESDPDKAPALARETGLMNPQIVNDIVSTIAEKSGVARAGEASNQLPNFLQRQRAASTITDLWIKEDIQGALNWMQTLPNTHSRTMNLLTWAKQATKASPEKALALASQIDGGITTTRNIIASAAIEIAKPDPKKTLDVLATAGISDSAQLTIARNVTMYVLQEEPDQTIRLFETFAQEQCYDQSATYQTELTSLKVILGASTNVRRASQALSRF